MGLETPTYISDLNASWPLGGDAKSTADDHLRNLKSAIKTTWPNVTGAVTATHTQLNAVFLNGTAVASTSGTSIDFSSIPSYAKRITISLTDVSASATAAVTFQLGDSGGVENSGYLSMFAASSGSTGQDTAGFTLRSLGASGVIRGGSVTFVLQDATTNTWVATGIFYFDDGGIPGVEYIAGSKSTSAALDRVRITTVAGTATFDAGKINVQFD